jgi:protein-S-isoprenylcysteine O-methyltransferase Ste14
VAISETVLILAGGTAVLSILFGIRLAMRAVAGSAAAPRSDGGQAAGVALAAGGFVMIAIGTRRFAAAGTNIPPTLPTTALVVDGIYGRTRNPLYLGTTLIYLGLSVAAGSLWAIALLVPLLWVINVGVVKREERYLERKFGDAYRDYKARVRRWI